jgi:hypothetical protein
MRFEYKLLVVGTLLMALFWLPVLLSWVIRLVGLGLIGYGAIRLWRTIRG